MSNYKRFYKEGYNYVFFTIVTCNRTPILINNIELLRNAFKYALHKYKFEIFACSVMKDHIHLILKLENSKDYSQIIRLIKYYFSIHFNNIQKSAESKVKKREKDIWQRRFWEHTIRDEKDLQIHLDYIHYNSYKHYQIAPKSWKFSSFLKFVKQGCYDIEWCNAENKNNIAGLNFE